MDEELVERLRALMGRMPADATAAPVGRPVPQPTIGPVSPGTPPSPRPARGLMAAVARSAQAGGGLANELLNPVRAGASARQMVNEAIPAARQGNIGRAAGLGALAAMSVPGVPGPDDAARMARGPLRVTARSTMPKAEQEAWHMAGSAQNPLVERQRMVMQGDRPMGVYAVEPSGERDFTVHSIRALEPGGGRAVLKHLTDAADKSGVTLRLTPHPFGSKAMSAEALERWYARNGFVWDGQMMVRRPPGADVPARPRFRIKPR